MTANTPVSDAGPDRYGPASFIAALVNILVLGLITWMFVGAYIVLIGPPVLLIDAGIGYALSLVGGRIGQVGRGMLIGCLAVLVAIVGAVAVFLVGKAIGM